ncbi:MAG: aldo/keto reductase [Chloroflexi bacterium]|nr:aldo/keto reductase [Chloroflexota bacterium]MDA1228601.1 aldo/keto reductase [Chloroflexota bacterium]
MEYRKLGKLDVSAVGLGTLRTFDVDSEEDVAVRKEIVDNCLTEDINLIDSANFYGLAEKVVGLVTEGRRDKFYLATKVRCEGKEAGLAQIENSFSMFKTDYIDLFQVHNMVDWETHIPTLQALKAEGRTGMVGVSAMVHEAYPTIANLMREGSVDTIQIPYNVMERGCEEELLPLAEELGVGVLVMEPLKKGRYVKELKQQPNLTPLAELGIKTWAQALIAWVLGDTRVTAAIPTTSRPERIHENAVAGHIGPMPQELRDYVRKETERCLEG